MAINVLCCAVGLLNSVNAARHEVRWVREPCAEVARAGARCAEGMSLCAYDSFVRTVAWPCIVAAVSTGSDRRSLVVQASVNLAMETALVRVLLLPNIVPDGVSGWRQLLQAAGERLAQVGLPCAKGAKGPAYKCMAAPCSLALSQLRVCA